MLDYKRKKGENPVNRSIDKGEKLARTEIEGAAVTKRRLKRR